MKSLKKPTTALEAFLVMLTMKMMRNDENKSNSHFVAFLQFLTTCAAIYLHSLIYEMIVLI